MDGYVYFIMCGDDGPIKIGYARSFKHVIKRLATAQVYNPALLTLISIVSGNRNTEIAYHKKFKEYKILGEWFVPVKEILEEINSYILINKTAEQLRIPPKTGSENYGWKGKNAGKSSKIRRVRPKYKDQTKCERCAGIAHDLFFKDRNYDNDSAENIMVLCRRCRMELDGTLDAIISWTKNIKPTLPKKPKIPCIICGEKDGIRNKRCHTCSEYFRRNGIERTEKPGPKQPVPCIICEQLVIRPAKGKCHTCYEFFRRNGFDRNVFLSLDNYKDKITDDVIKLRSIVIKSKVVKVTFEKAKLIRKMWATGWYSQEFLAKEAGISVSYLWDIIYNKHQVDKSYIYVQKPKTAKLIKYTRQIVEAKDKLSELKSIKTYG